MNRSSIALLAALSLTFASGAAAQAPTAQPTGCTYATCALRVESGFWKTRLVRGASGEHDDGPLSGFGGGVEPLLTGPDSAAQYGRAYVHDQRTAGALGLLGALGYAVVLYRTDNFGRGDQLGTEGVIALLSSAGFGIAASAFHLRATRALSRSVWWYNSALPH